MKTRNKRAAVDVTDDYLALVQAFPLRPIRTKSQNAAAIAMLLPLAAKATHSPRGLSQGESDYLGALSILVHQYEAAARNRLTAGATPLEMLKHLMAEAGMNSGGLGQLIQSRSAASMILSGERAISRNQAKILAERFQLPVGKFL